MLVAPTVQMLRWQRPNLVGLGQERDGARCVVPLRLLGGGVTVGYPTGRKPPERKWVGIPPRVFLYTLDQVSTLVNLTVVDLKGNHLWYEGRETGSRPTSKMKAVNISEPEEKPDWRVAEAELIRWMKRKGFKYYERGWAE